MLRLARRYHRRPNLEADRIGATGHEHAQGVVEGLLSRREPAAARPGPVWLPVPVDGRQYWLVPVEQP